MNRRVVVLAALVAFGGCAGAAGKGGLDGYVGQADPSFSWSRESERTAGNVKITTLKMRSQTWRGIPWDHHLQVFMPANARFPKTAGLLITGGDPGVTDSLLGATIAQRIEAPFVILYNIPNQPLYDGKREDDLIAYTFDQYLQTGDETWPLLFPMVKSAVRAMDAIQELSKKEWPTPVDDFIVTGASKRGWTTYLTGASDRRVRGIAPMVFDNLHFAKQMPRQLELWGKYSEQIEDYSRRGLQQKMDTERGRKMTAMVDPWFYRRRLTMPKLLIHGTNDRYWSTDSTRIYWNSLPGEKYLLAIPNAGHGLEDRERLLNALAAFFRATAAGRALPHLSASSRERAGNVSLVVRSDAAPTRVRLWTAQAPDLDFRPIKWQESLLPPMVDHTVRASVPAPASGGLALFAEAEYTADGRPYTLSVPPAVYGRRTAAR
jgi:PhoPQ-activated pathogenicity-related protein